MRKRRSGISTIVCGVSMMIMYLILAFSGAWVFGLRMVQSLSLMSKSWFIVMPLGAIYGVIYGTWLCIKKWKEEERDEE